MSIETEAGAPANEAHALRQDCAMWRRRAEVQATANTTLLNIARGTKDYALRMRAERDAEHNRYVLLKRKLVELLCVPSPLPPLPLCPR